MTILEFKKLNDTGVINIFTNEVFLGDGVKKPYNVSFLTSKPDVSVRDINYTKEGEKRTMKLASVNMISTDAEEQSKPISVTVNSQLVACFEQAVDVKAVYGVEGEGVVADSGSEYNRYTFSLAPLLVEKPAK